RLPAEAGGSRVCRAPYRCRLRPGTDGSVDADEQLLQSRARRMEMSAAARGEANRGCQSQARALWARSDRGSAKGGYLRAGSREARLWRKYFASGTICGIRKRAGSDSGLFVDVVAVATQRKQMGNTHGTVSAD